MPRHQHINISTLLGGGLLAFVLSGCGGSVAGDLCDRLAQCNNLQGESVSECSDRNQRALENLGSGARADCEASVNECLKLESCANFTQCRINC